MNYFSIKRQERITARKYISENHQHEEDLNKKLAKSDGINRGSENRRRLHSANLLQTKAHLLEKSREGMKNLSS